MTLQEVYEQRLLPTFEAMKLRLEADRPHCTVTIDKLGTAHRFYIHGETLEGNYGAMISVVDLDRKGDGACSIEQYGSLGMEQLYAKEWIEYTLAYQLLGELFEGKVRAMLGQIDRMRDKVRIQRAASAKYRGY